MNLDVRPWVEADEPGLSAAIARSLDSLRPWVPFAEREPLTRAERLRFIRDSQRWHREGGDLLYGIFLDGEVAGGCGLHPRIGPRALEVGYWTAVELAGRGIATAAVAEMVRVGFAMPSVDRLEIHHDVNNHASRRVAEKSGFRFDREERKGDRCDRVWILRRPAP